LCLIKNSWQIVIISYRLSVTTREADHQVFGVIKVLVWQCGMNHFTFTERTFIMSSCVLLTQQSLKDEHSTSIWTMWGSWIYNYLWNQCLSTLTLWVRIPFREVCSIQHYVIKFVSDLWQVSVFFLCTPVSSTNKIDRHDITVR
jgi:hypothetical protein